MPKRYEKAMTPEEIAATEDAEIDFSDIPQLDDHFWNEAKLKEPRQTRGQRDASGK